MGVDALQDISSDWDAVRRITGAPAREIDASRSEVEKLFPDTYFQRYLYGFIRHLKPQPKIIIETGTGTSTAVIAEAIKRNAHGELHTVATDSYNQLVLVAEDAWPWDIFVHNNEDHEVKAQTFELEFAWKMLRGGGLLIVNAYTWGTHAAFEQFLLRKHKRFMSCGGAAVVIKPQNSKPCDDRFRREREAMNLATLMEAYTEKE